MVYSIWRFGCGEDEIGIPGWQKSGGFVCSNSEGESLCPYFSGFMSSP